MLQFICSMSYIIFQNDNVQHNSVLIDKYNSWSSLLALHVIQEHIS